MSNWIQAENWSRAKEISLGDMKKAESMMLTNDWQKSRGDIHYCYSSDC